MNNYNKIGYSVPEVAQIFGCVPLTIRRYIYSGELKADVSKVNTKHIIRIRREHLVEYMREHRERFSDELLKQFKVDVSSDDKSSKEKVDFAPGAYTAKDVSELSGAWGKGSAKPVNNTKVKYSNSGAASVSKRPEVNPYSYVKREKKYPAYDIVADGNVVISGCEKLTVGKIVDALITDRNLEITNISIVRK